MLEASLAASQLMEKPVPALLNVSTWGIGVAVARALSDGEGESAELEHPESNSSTMPTAVAIALRVLERFGNVARIDQPAYDIDGTFLQD